MALPVKRSEALPSISTEVSKALGETSKAAVAAFSSATEAGDVLAALDLAANVQGLRDLFSMAEIQARIVALQDTPIGFRTDRDPKIVNRRTSQPNKPYDYETVKDAVIEGMLRGLQLVGNQFNIISGRFYCTKEGFEYLIRRLEYVTDFRPVIGVPKSQANGAVVDCSASWQQNGKPCSIEASIPVKTSDSGSVDQYIGKATRKFLKRCYEVMSGNSLPEGDAQDGDGVAGLSLASTPVPVAALPPEVAAKLAAPVATLTEQQQEILSTALGRQLTPIGVAAFRADACAAFQVPELAQIPAEHHSKLMAKLADAGSRERWNRGCGAESGEPILSAEEVAALTPQVVEPEPEAQHSEPSEPSEPPARPARQQPARAAAAAPQQAAPAPAPAAEEATEALQAELV